MGSPAGRGEGVAFRPPPSVKLLMLRFMSLGAAMDHQAAKLLSGHVGACAVLVEVLIDKGIISQREVYDRFQRARSAAGHGPGSRAVVRELADIVDYLKPDTEDVGTPPLDRTALIGETVLVVEGDGTAGRELQTLLERAGAEVLVVRTAAEA